MQGGPKGGVENHETSERFLNVLSFYLAERAIKLISFVINE